jgi:hypothetical protein
MLAWAVLFLASVISLNNFGICRLFSLAPRLVHDGGGCMILGTFNSVWGIAFFGESRLHCLLRSAGAVLGSGKGR